MSLERKDVRAKLDHDLHAALEILCDVQGVTQAQFIESVLVPVIRRRVHEATLIAARTTVSGIAGNIRETQAGPR
jgi:hypothetical protein